MAQAAPNLLRYPWKPSNRMLLPLLLLSNFMHGLSQEITPGLNDTPDYFSDAEASPPGTELGISLLDLPNFTGAWTPPPVEAWASRNIYQILTDRFAQFPDGYHGYWPLNLSKLNDHFGEAQDLENFITAAHELDMWVMLDIVPNHMGFSNSYDAYTPFNQSDYFHDCGPCLGSSCGYSNEIPLTVTRCRLSELPDLDQSKPFVAKSLVENYIEIIERFQIDGLRVDAAKHTNSRFLIQMTQAIPGIFSIGEFTVPAAAMAELLNDGALHSSLNFPMHDVIDNVFSKGGPINQIPQLIAVNTVNMPDFVNVLGNFIDNHDEERFLCRKTDISLFKNALAVVVLIPGIPVLYYGSEQSMLGQRDPLWSEGYRQDTEMYEFIARLMRVRKTFSVWNASYVTEPGKTSVGAWLFYRGDVIVLVNRYSDRSFKYFNATNEIDVPREYAGITFQNVFNPQVCSLVLDW
eukprot:gene14380-20381_t